MGDMTDEEIYRKYADDLVRFATGLVGPFDAQDVMTDSCLQAFRSKGWDGVRDPRAYLYRSVLNHARSHHRSTLRRRLREMRAAAPEKSAPVEVDVDVLAASGFTTAACGSGCWGDFAVSVPYELDEDTAGFVTVYEESAEDGSREHVVTYEVMLAASA